MRKIQDKTSWITSAEAATCIRIRHNSWETTRSYLIDSSFLILAFHNHFTEKQISIEMQDMLINNERATNATKDPPAVSILFFHTRRHRLPWWRRCLTSNPLGMLPLGSLTMPKGRHWTRPSRPNISITGKSFATMSLYFRKWMLLTLVEFREIESRNFGSYHDSGWKELIRLLKWIFNETPWESSFEDFLIIQSLSWIACLLLDIMYLSFYLWNTVSSIQRLARYEYP